MVIFVTAVSLFVVALILSKLKAGSDLRETWSHDGPGRIAEYLRSRNRTIAGVVTALAFFLALIEIFIPEFHYIMQDVQYSIGSGRLVAVVDLDSGGGISWGLYLASLLSIVLGVLIGTKWACTEYGQGSIAFGKLV
jgi:hypothetical protein